MSRAMKLIDLVVSKRSSICNSVAEFNFNMNRVRYIRNTNEPPKQTATVLYWMTREQRVQDNWSLLYAQKIAFKHKLKLMVCFCMVPTFLNATIRQYKFMLEGLKEVEEELTNLHIPFHLLIGSSKECLPDFVDKNNVAAVVCDFSPLRISNMWLNELKTGTPENVAIIQIDGHNVVPCWHASDRMELAAFQIRPKLMSKLNEFLTEFPPLIKHSFNSAEFSKQPIDWDACYNSLNVDMTVKEVSWAKPGYKSAVNMLQSFMQERLMFYENDRNNPTKNAISNLSPWLHFGQLSAQRVILEVNKYKSDYPKDVEKFIDEALIWRELTENYCFYQKDYDNINGCEEWARKTLEKHTTDKRRYVYSLEDFEYARTHDPLWNAGQIEMIKEGKMHCFTRMYWAKMILEWTENAEKALEIAIYLNDKYELDGRDPNGYGGIMWAICGVHDRPFAERPIYGTIRFMSYEGSKKKFDVYSYTRKYNRL